MCACQDMSPIFIGNSHDKVVLAEARFPPLSKAGWIIECHMDREPEASCELYAGVILNDQKYTQDDCVMSATSIGFKAWPKQGPQYIYAMGSRSDNAYGHTNPRGIRDDGGIGQYILDAFLSSNGDTYSAVIEFRMDAKEGCDSLHNYVCYSLYNYVFITLP